MALIVEESPLHGVGVFTTLPIPKGAMISLLPLARYGRKFHGFNWSEYANIENRSSVVQRAHVTIMPDGGGYGYVRAIRDISAGEELTLVKYESGNGGRGELI